MPPWQHNISSVYEAVFIIIGFYDHFVFWSLLTPTLQSLLFISVVLKDEDGKYISLISPFMQHHNGSSYVEAYYQGWSVTRR